MMHALGKRGRGPLCLAAFLNRIMQTNNKVTPFIYMNGCMNCP